MRNLVLWAWNLSPWSTREVPVFLFLICLFLQESQLRTQKSRGKIFSFPKLFPFIVPHIFCILSLSFWWNKIRNLWQDKKNLNVQCFSACLGLLPPLQCVWSICINQISLGDTFLLNLWAYRPQLWKLSTHHLMYNPLSRRRILLYFGVKWVE